MSGIFGLLNFARSEVSARELERMAQALAHLGPDGSRFRRSGAEGFGALLMRITQEDRSEAQPLADSAAGLIFVSDARLDNREELAAALSLETKALETMPDSALMFAAWKKWRTDCVEHLLGDFVFAVWDAADQTLTIARDHMGQRHVFYHQGEGFFAFASEIKGLWALPQVPRVLREERLVRHMLRYRPDDVHATNYEGIYFVPGGTVLTRAADGTISTRRYWEPHADPAHEGHDEAYYIETYRKVLTEAVQCRLRRAAWPAGLLMGGGFDSSAICALGGSVVSAQGRKLIAVSSVMPEDYRGSIRHTARHWCEMCRRTMPHLDMRYVTREGLDVFSFMQHAFLTGDNVHSPNRYATHAMFAELAKAGARIVMDGHGGDYTINPRGQKALVRMLAKGHVRRFVREFRATRRHLGLSVKQTLVRHVLSNLVPASWMHVWIKYRNGLALFGETMPLSRQLISRRRKVSPRRPSAKTPRSAMQAILRSQQDAPAQAYSIAAAMHGLEFTQPFHDKRVVEFGLAIPEEMQFKDGKTRALARAALKDLYPPEYQDRPTTTDGLLPDFLTMAKRIEPRVLAEIDRMEQAGYLARYFDFPRMRRMLTRRTLEQHSSGAEFDTRQAMLAFIAARYIEWFRQDNR